jgi:rhomboid family protein
MYRGTSIINDIKGEYRQGSVIIKLIFANIAVFLFINIVMILFRLFSLDEAALVFYRQFTLPADFTKLMSRPWTLFTHMFSHKGILHILFNMLWLYWMGKILMEYAGPKKILPIYILGALTGAFLFIISYNVFPGFSAQLPYAEALGASAGVMAIVVATATLLPNYTIGLMFIGPVRLKYLALVAVLLDVVGVNGLNAGGSIAHLGGAFFGFIFIRQLKNGNDLGRGLNQMIDGIISLFYRQKGPKMYYKNPKKAARAKAQQKKKSSSNTPKNKQEKLDRILDKISQSGYDGLTKEEKDFLFNISKED